MAKPFLAIVLGMKGDYKQANIQHADPETLTFAEIHAYMRKKEEPNIQLSNKVNGYTVHYFGYNLGKGQQNTHKLDKPHDEDVFIGDILMIVGDTWTKPVNMKVKDWLSKPSEQSPVKAKQENLEEEEESNGEEEESNAEEEEEEEDEEEDEDIDPIDDTEAVIIPEEEPEEEPVVKKKIVKKKLKITSAFAKQQALLDQDKFEELSPETHVPNKTMVDIIRTFFDGTELSEEKQLELELVIFITAHNEAKKRYVISHWKNPLFKQLYNIVAMRIISNLSPNSYVQNKGLFEKFVSGEFDVSTLADFNSYDLYPEHWKEMEDRRLMREQAHMEGNKRMATDQFKCNRCKKRECTYYEMQTRSADEPMTLFITCVNCGKRWRQ